MKKLGVMMSVFKAIAGIGACVALYGILQLVMKGSFINWFGLASVIGGGIATIGGLTCSEICNVKMAEKRVDDLNKSKEDKTVEIGTLQNDKEIDLEANLNTAKKSKTSNQTMTMKDDDEKQL